MTAFFDVVLPFFGLIALGFFAGRQGWVSEAMIGGLTQFVFRFALPALLFRVLATQPFERVWAPEFLLVYGMATLAVLAGGFVIGRKVFRLNLGEATLHGFSSGTSNLGFMGLPLIVGLLGEAAALPVIVALAFDLFVTFTLLLLLMETDRHAGGANALLKVVKGWLTNPMMVAILLGGIASAISAPLPGFLDRLLAMLGAAAGPVALFAIGAALVGRPLSEKGVELGAMTVMKLAVHPLLFVGLAVWLGGIDPLWVAAGLLVCALPTAGNAFIIAGTYERYVNRSSAVVLVTTAVSVVTVSILAVLL